MNESRWLRFWFQPSTPVNLGVSRALLFAGVFLLYLPEDFSAWGSVSRGFWMPIPLFSGLGLVPLSAGALEVLQTVWRISLILSAIGLFSRVNMWVAAVLGFYLLGLPHNFGHTYHFDALLVITFAILACSRAADAWSVDALIKRAEEPAPSGEYTWPIRMVWVAMSLVFAAAGLAKLRYGGLEWITSDNMAILLMRAPYHVSDADPITQAGLWIAERPWMSRSLATFALVAELGFALALVSRTARIVMVPSAFLMLVGIRILMGPTFGGFLVANVFWVPWTAVGARLADWIRPRRRATVLYDGGCGLCSTTIATLRRLDLLGVVTLIDVVSQWGLIEQRFPTLNRADCLTDMHVVVNDGTIAVGFDGYRELAKILPVGWLVLPVLYLPGVPAVGRRIYRMVADRRGGSSCVVPPMPRA